MEKIEISKSPSADSRTAKTQPSVDELKKSTEMHISDVQKAVKFITDLLQERSTQHNHTKLENMDEFHAALNSGHIKDTTWYQKHITEERHHLKSHVPEDVNLVDVIEHVVDCTMAGLARSGDVYDIDLSPDVLTVAVNNTVELLKKHTVVNDDSETDLMNSTIENPD